MSNSIVYTIVHSGEEVQTEAVTSALSNEEIKAQCVANWPELANATINVDANNRVTFAMPTGTKQSA